MTNAETRWGEDIAVERVNGIAYRMYTERPRCVIDVLEFCERWGWKYRHWTCPNTEDLQALEPRHDPADVVGRIEKHEVERWNAVPTMVSRVLEQPAITTHDRSSPGSTSIDGAPGHAELMQRMRLRLPRVSSPIPTGYGLTEKRWPSNGRRRPHQRSSSRQTGVHVGFMLSGARPGMGPHRTEEFLEYRSIIG